MTEVHGDVALNLNLVPHPQCTPIFAFIIGYTLGIFCLLWSIASWVPKWASSMERMSAWLYPAESEAGPIARAIGWTKEYHGRIDFLVTRIVGIPVSLLILSLLFWDARTQPIC